MPQIAPGLLYAPATPRQYADVLPRPADCRPRAGASLPAAQAPRRPSVSSSRAEQSSRTFHPPPRDAARSAGRAGSLAHEVVRHDPGRPANQNRDRPVSTRPCPLSRRQDTSNADSRSEATTGAGLTDAIQVRLTVPERTKSGYRATRLATAVDRGGRCRRHVTEGGRVVEAGRPRSVPVEALRYGGSRARIRVVGGVRRPLAARPR